MIKKCKICDKDFVTYPSRIKRGLGKYCSKDCLNKGLLGNKCALGQEKHLKKRGEKNVMWKGALASYSAIHAWVIVRLGRVVVNN